MPGFLTQSSLLTRSADAPEIINAVRDLQRRLGVDSSEAGAWEDLRFPSQAIAIGGLSAPPGQGEDGTLLFNGIATVETIAGIVQLPHDWKVGSGIRPHVHWKKTTDAAGDVVWTWRYSIANVAGDFPTFSSIENGTLLQPSSTAALAATHHITGFSEIDMSGFESSCILRFQLGRLPANGGDTYEADAALMEFDIHYRRDAFGSDEEYTKDYPTPT